MSSESQKIRRQLIDDYYASFYDSYLFDRDLLVFGFKYLKEELINAFRVIFA
jgi:hypothetical protein